MKQVVSKSTTILPSLLRYQTTLEGHLLLQRAFMMNSVMNHSLPNSQQKTHHSIDNISNRYITTHQSTNSHNNSNNKNNNQNNKSSQQNHYTNSNNNFNKYQAVHFTSQSSSSSDESQTKAQATTSTSNDNTTQNTSNQPARRRPSLLNRILRRFALGPIVKGIIKRTGIDFVLFFFCFA